jgi:hypothetical protein
MSTAGLRSKLDTLRAQRDLLRQEVAALSSKDRELAEQHSAQSHHSPADASHNQPPSMQSPGFGLCTPIADRIEAGLRALSEPSPLPIAGEAAWSIHRMPEPPALPAVAVRCSLCVCCGS